GSVCVAVLLAVCCAETILVAGATEMARRRRQGTGPSASPAGRTARPSRSAMCSCSSTAR
ncbi:hypothetical protein EE612_010188, partial [Oryza sativa]